MNDENTAAGPDTGRHFLKQWIAEDVAAGRTGGQVVTRFPPEPNGYLHIGHAKAICIDFGMAREFGGQCNLRMDDTNPSKESDEYVESIKRDIRWLGFDWGSGFYSAADLFGQMYEIAENLIRSGHAYVCGLTQEEWKAYRGIPTAPGRESPTRNRSSEENLALFRRMRAGEFPDGSLCLRAKIDMASPNIHFRDPVLYRILHVPHYHAGDTWCIYPMYDFAHPIEDAFEGVTHSMCTLEFEVHRPLYDWVIDRMDEMGLLVVRNGVKIRPQQREFARLNLTYTVMSKRKLLQLVEEKHVTGWDDPRMPTICGLRRRGYTPEAIRDFCERIGVSKFESETDVALLEYCVRDDLNRRAVRRMAVLDPVKVVIDNLPEGHTAMVEVANNPEDPAAGTRKIPFSREVYIERDDFMEVPAKKFFRMAPGQEVRLRAACLFTCTHVVKDDAGTITEIHGTYDPDSTGGNAADGRKVKGTLHWVSVAHAVPLEVRLIDRLFTVPDPLGDPQRDFLSFLNPDSCRTVTAYAEPALQEAEPGERFQFERLGYFCADTRDSRPGAPVFNRTVTLKDSWARQTAGSKR
ncbi:MAG TPA: glutamine--tRNA ligase/YqeY domain fusion protein [Kiritimatiellia bacterium]|jgi:glutaminyl-tRNA synthetase|nr:glutamine--tRNA ligase/YqeY domain fusion protein [Kiritimatiellia bacterium]HOR98177.1 glutamine--tRNA ligase/YqeY domain fusion protein [Kiritimatiellia bacterium]HPK37451.1 glutamine--tRNA ligase/YqeY domain fusion protein [Kiritimatiellia bacterium]HPW75327.1 glutamine--tRNA ligase/YqeY domain fusion protein [Kiritimatiellia bacterium]HRU20100.1 glutamine--tRNA ligase/YqeY domain fusion protein [Kiritimatiellia bacterium]